MSKEKPLTTDWPKTKQKRVATDKQIMYLKRMGAKQSELKNLTVTGAKKLIEEYRQKPSPKMKSFLKYNGFEKWYIDRLTKDKAGQLIAELKGVPKFKGKENGKHERKI